MKIDFRVDPDAVAFMRRELQRQDSVEKMVIVFAPEVVGETSLTTVIVAADQDMPIGDLIQRGQREFQKLSFPRKLRWTIGAAIRDRFPESDIHVVDEIAFYLPIDSIAIANGRVIRFRDGALIFDPSPPEFSEET